MKTIQPGEAVDVGQDWSAMEEWQAREMADAREEWRGFWLGLLLALFISGTVLLVGLCVYWSLQTAII